MNATKPTVRSNDIAAMRAIQQWDNYRVLPTATGWAVLNKKTGDTYAVCVDGSCNCPHAKKANPTGAVCKHYSRACLEERLKAMADTPAAPRPETTVERRARVQAQIARDFPEF